MDGWRPIESAPRDGTEVDLWIVTDDLKGFRQPECVWRDGAWYDAILEDDRIDAPWDDGTDFHGRRPMRTATHWMPLPEPPEPSK